MGMDSDDLADIRDPYPPVPLQGLATWFCLQCGYKPNTGDNCRNCGRDRWGTDVGPLPVENEVVLHSTTGGDKTG